MRNGAKNNRIVIVGPAASGKDFLKKKFKDRGFKIDVSYTTRPPREGEVDTVDYHFITENDFWDRHYDFYEYAKHGDYWYGTGEYEWEHFDIFIMETHGISEITPEDRKNCFIIYLNPPQMVRQDRLRNTRGWDDENIAHRTKMDNEKFENFTDFDIEINNPKF